MKTRRILHSISFAVSILCWAAGALAQTYPGKSIRIIVPFAAGGPTDVLARSIANNLSDTWGQSVLIDNRPGANTIIGTDAAAKSPPDGHTLLLMANNLTINPGFYQNLPYDAIRDFAPISLFATSPLLLVVPSSAPAKSVKELIALARTRPGGLHFGSPGNGSPPHLAGELFNTLAGVKLVHVPYKAVTTAVTDLIGGQLDLMFPGSPIALPHVKTGKLRAIATTGAKRTAAAPELPTVAEAGLPNYEIALWYGLLAPANTPPAIIQRLHAEVTRIVALPAVSQQWAALGAEPLNTTPEQFAAYLKDDIVKWQKVVRDSGAKMD